MEGNSSLVDMDLPLACDGMRPVQSEARILSSTWCCSTVLIMNYLRLHRLSAYGKKLLISSWLRTCTNSSFKGRQPLNRPRRRAFYFDEWRTRSGRPIKRSVSSLYICVWVVYVYKCVWNMSSVMASCHKVTGESNFWKRLQNISYNKLHKS